MIHFLFLSHGKTGAVKENKFRSVLKVINFSDFLGWSILYYLLSGFFELSSTGGIPSGRQVITFTKVDVPSALLHDFPFPLGKSFYLDKETFFPTIFYMLFSSSPLTFNTDKIDGKNFSTSNSFFSIVFHSNKLAFTAVE